MAAATAASEGWRVIYLSAGGTAIVFIESMSELHTELASIRDKTLNS